MYTNACTAKNKEKEAFNLQKSKVGIKWECVNGEKGGNEIIIIFSKILKMNIFKKDPPI